MEINNFIWLRAEEFSPYLNREENNGVYYR